jgi:hypothetical protein
MGNHGPRGYVCSTFTVHVGIKMYIKTIHLQSFLLQRSIVAVRLLHPSPPPPRRASAHCRLTPPLQSSAAPAPPAPRRRNMVSALFITLAASSVPNALHEAVVSDDLEALQAAIKSGASPEDRDALGYTVLMRAADDGALDAARILVEAGVQVNARDNSKATALHLASEGGFTELVQLLIDQAPPPPLHHPPPRRPVRSPTLTRYPSAANHHRPPTLTRTHPPTQPRHRSRSHLSGMLS